jgi:hypothetical protein
MRTITMGCVFDTEAEVLKKAKKTRKYPTTIPREQRDLRPPLWWLFSIRCPVKMRFEMQSPLGGAGKPRKAKDQRANAISNFLRAILLMLAHPTLVPNCPVRKNLSVSASENDWTAADVENLPCKGIPC